MIDVLSNLDEQTKNKNMDLLSSILQSPISPSQVEDEEERKEGTSLERRKLLMFHKAHPQQIMKKK